MKVFEKTCPQCGRRFASFHRYAIYCSRSCVSASRRKKPLVVEETPFGEAVCPACGKTFQKKMRIQIYCSRVCQKKTTNAEQRRRDWTEYTGWRCHDCGRPSDTYRCPVCQRKFNQVHKECFV